MKIAIAGLLVAMLSGTAPEIASSATPMKDTFSEVMLALPPNSPPPYRALLRADRRVHLVCPFDYRNGPTVRAYFPGRTLAVGSHLAGMTVLSVQRVGDPRRHFAECSDVLSGFDHLAHDTRSDSYLWAPKKPTHQLSFEQMGVQIKAHNYIAFSGLPIVSDLGSNLGFCFEMSSTADQPPSYWLALLGVNLPSWAARAPSSG